jgi:SAM-dependent methyltransferase
MLRQLAVSDGSYLRLKSSATCQSVMNGYLVFDENQSLFVECDFEECISPLSASLLLRDSMALAENSQLFDKPEMAKSVFSWDFQFEIDKLAELFASRKHLRGLDVGCGYGRLLVPLSKRGYNIDGVDISYSLIADAAQNIPDESGSRVFSTDVSNFCSPRAYGFAYAAMNSLRYLETSFALKRHLQLLSKSLLPGSPYAFCVSLTPTPHSFYQQSWNFQHEQVPHTVRWSHAAYNHLTNQIIETVELFKRDSDGVRNGGAATAATGGRPEHPDHIELQTQGNYTYATINRLLQENQFIVEQITDDRFNSASVNELSCGNFWFLSRLEN